MLPLGPIDSGEPFYQLALRAGLKSGAGTADRRAMSTSGELVSQLGGKRLAVVGFENQEYLALRQLIEEKNAFCRLLDAANLAGLQNTLQGFDAVMVSLDSGQVRSQWDEADWKNCGRPLVVSGPAAEIASRIGLFAEAQRQFALAPCAAAELVLRLEAAVAATPGGGAASPEAPTVLLADDDPSITALLKATLTRQGIVCRVAADGGEALALAQEMRPQVMVLDVNMPTRDGFEVLAAMRKDPATRHVRVIMLTGCEQESDVLRGFGLGTDDYVVKPFNPLEVAARVKRLLGGVA